MSKRRGAEDNVIKIMCSYLWSIRNTMALILSEMGRNGKLLKEV